MNKPPRFRWTFKLTSNKLPARAMMYAVLLVTLIALITGNVISLSYTQRDLQQRDFQQSKLIKNLESATQIALSQTNNEPSLATLDLFNLGNDSIQIEKSWWGLFPMSKVAAWVHTGKYVDSLQKSFLLGAELQNECASALYLCNGLGGLQVCGNTIIRGTAYLPERGIKAGIVLNRHFERETFVEGKMLVADRYLPELDNRIFENLRKQFLSPSFGEWKDTIIQSFHAPTLVFKSKYLNIDKVFWRGNIIVIADSSISFSAQANVENILAFAPKIQFQEGFSGNLQAFASQEIIVEKAVFLQYPSIIALLENSDFKTSIFVDSLAQIDGLILAQNNPKTTEKLTVWLHRNSLVRGQVFVQGFLQPDGVIYGNASCEKVALRTGAAYQENYLLDAVLDYTKLPKLYANAPFLKKPVNQFVIVQYLP